MKVEARLKVQHPQDLVARMEAQHEKTVLQAAPRKILASASYRSLNPCSDRKVARISA
jgi:hypothetical protein